MGRKSAFRFAAAVSLCAATPLLYGCAQDTSGHATAAGRVASQVATETPQERSLRVRDELVRLGCDTNSCIQTYFACEDGLLSGAPCEFYRQHPMK